MPHPRAGFTLLEMILVLAIILVASAIAVPAIDGMMADGRIKAARDLVRARLADIRGLAMKEGRPYKFSTTDQTGKFKIEPEDANAPSDSEDPATIMEGELPENVLFSGEPLVVYLPDGTARADADVLFGFKGVNPIGLQVRALTGAVTFIEPAKDSK